MSVSSGWPHKIYNVTTSHCRFFPVQHFFKYPLFYFGFDLDNVSSLSGINNSLERNEKGSFLHSFLYSHNRFSLFSLRDEDYFFGNHPAGDMSIKNSLMLYLKSELGFCPEFTRIELVTTPRILGYSFNPVSFYFCYTRDDATNKDYKLSYILYEVHNTFGERHTYVLQPENFDRTEAIILERRFHVSPFNDRSGTYSTTLADPRVTGELDVSITLVENQRKKLRATVHGKGYPASPSALLQCVISYPVNAFLALPRIFYQAYLLHYIKKLPVYQRPAPLKPFLLNLAPSYSERYCLNLFRTFIRELEVFSGIRIVIEEPRFIYKENSHPEEDLSPGSGEIVIELHSYELCNMLVWQLRGENFLSIWAITHMTGEWKCSNLALLLECLLRFQCKELSLSAASAVPFLYTVKKMKTLFLLSRWRKNASLSRPFLDRFLAHATLEERSDDTTDSIRFFCPDSLRRGSLRNTETNFYILALPLHNNYSRFFSLDSPFDVLAARTALDQKFSFSILPLLLLHLLLLFWALLRRFVELSLFHLVADFHHLGDPNRVEERFYANLAFILNRSKGLSNNEEPSNPILNFCFQSQVNLFCSKAKPPGEPWLQPESLHSRCSLSQVVCSDEEIERKRLISFTFSLWDAVSNL